MMSESSKHSKFLSLIFILKYCKLILKSPSGRINKGIVLYCIVFYSSAEWAVKVDSRVNSYAAIPFPSHPNHNHSSAQPTVHESDSTSSRVLTPITIQPYHDGHVTYWSFPHINLQSLEELEVMHAHLLPFY